MLLSNRTHVRGRKRAASFGQYSNTPHFQDEDKDHDGEEFGNALMVWSRSENPPSVGSPLYEMTCVKPTVLIKNLKGKRC